MKTTFLLAILSIVAIGCETLFAQVTNDPFRTFNSQPLSPTSTSLRSGLPVGGFPGARAGALGGLGAAGLGGATPSPLAIRYPPPQLVTRPLKLRPPKPRLVVTTIDSRARGRLADVDRRRKAIVAEIRAARGRRDHATVVRLVRELERLREDRLAVVRKVGHRTAPPKPTSQPFGFGGTTSAPSGLGPTPAGTGTGTETRTTTTPLLPIPKMPPVRSENQERPY